MKRERSNSTTIGSPDPLSCMEDYFGEEHDFESLKGNAIFMAFQNKFRQINKICLNRRLNIGEAKMMYGKRWTRVKWNELDNLQTWLISNQRRSIEILNPEMHRFIMSQTDYKSKTYQDWYLRGIEA